MYNSFKIKNIENAISWKNSLSCCLELDLKANLDFNKLVIDYRENKTFLSDRLGDQLIIVKSALGIALIAFEEELAKKKHKFLVDGKYTHEYFVDLFDEDLGYLKYKLPEIIETKKMKHIFGRQYIPPKAYPLMKKNTSSFFLTSIVLIGIIRKLKKEKNGHKLNELFHSSLDKKYRKIIEKFGVKNSDLPFRLPSINNENGKSVDDIYRSLTRSLRNNPLLAFESNQAILNVSDILLGNDLDRKNKLLKSLYLFRYKIPFDNVLGNRIHCSKVTGKGVAVTINKEEFTAIDYEKIHFFLRDSWLNHVEEIGFNYDKYFNVAERRHVIKKGKNLA